MARAVSAALYSWDGGSVINLQGIAPTARDRRTAMRISARNQIKGKVIGVTKGATTAHVRVEIGNGQVLTAAITNEAVDDLGLKADGSVYAVIKAFDVMIAVD